MSLTDLHYLIYSRILEFRERLQDLQEPTVVAFLHHLAIYIVPMGEEQSAPCLTTNATNLRRRLKDSIAQTSYMLCCSLHCPVQLKVHETCLSLASSGSARPFTKVPDMVVTESLPAYNISENVLFSRGLTLENLTLCEFCSPICSVRAPGFEEPVQSVV